MISPEGSAPVAFGRMIPEQSVVRRHSLFEVRAYLADEFSFRSRGNSAIRGASHRSLIYIQPCFVGLRNAPAYLN
jgi:hypothetical protein